MLYYTWTTLIKYVQGESKHIKCIQHHDSKNINMGKQASFNDSHKTTPNFISIWQNPFINIVLAIHAMFFSNNSMIHICPFKMREHISFYLEQVNKLLFIIIIIIIIIIILFLSWTSSMVPQTHSLEDMPYHFNYHLTLFTHMHKTYY